MRQLLYTFGFILLLLAAFLGVWWTQRYHSALDTLRDQVESEMNLLIADSYLIKTFQIIRSDRQSSFGGDRFQLRPQQREPIIMLGKRHGEVRREADRTTIVISEAEGGVTEVEVVVDETGFSLAQLPDDVRDSISRKFNVGLVLPPTSPPEYLRRMERPDLPVYRPGRHAPCFRYDPSGKLVPIPCTLPEPPAGPAPSRAGEAHPAPAVWARQVNKHRVEGGTMYYLTRYRGTILLGMFPEFLLGLILFGATGFAFASAYRNLYEQDRQLQQKDALVANVAHELKTPIATVGVALEALNVFGAAADPDRRREYLAIGQAELHRLDQMADRAIDSLQGGDLRQRLRREATNLSSAAYDAWRGLALRYQLPEDALKLTTAGDVRLAVDRHYWYHLVYNLLDNACKYGGRPLRIEVAVAGNRDAVDFVITDNGPGIPPAERENIFERFYRIDRPDEGHNVKGHGLGLSFVRQVARAHGGEVVVDNKPGRGARFQVRIPRGGRVKRKE